MTAIPFAQSYWVQPGLICAGHYPGDLDPQERDKKLRGLLDLGLRRIPKNHDPFEGNQREFILAWQAS